MGLLHPKIFVAGHRGMVGSAIVRKLLAQGHPVNRIVTRSHLELDLTNQVAVRAFFEIEKVDQVYMAAAKVGGIYANNTYPADFIFQNLMIQMNVIDAAFHYGVKKLLFLGSSCIYPSLIAQPMAENALLSGGLELTNEPYAIAKIAGIKLCESYNRQYGMSHHLDYRSIMPTNLYGPGDSYHLENAHVIPAMIRRFHEAKIRNLDKVVLWGTGTPKREFLFVDDLAAACIFVMNLEKELLDRHTLPQLSHINVGSGYDLTIRELAETIARVVGYRGRIAFDSNRPDGPPRKLLNSNLLKVLGFHVESNLESGLVKTYQDFLLNQIDC
jgi:GDP-L-fucose synthase